MEFLLSRNSAIVRDGLLLNFAIFRQSGAALRESGRTICLDLDRICSITNSAAEDFAIPLTPN
jgi:hypothetical protein